MSYPAFFDDPTRACLDEDPNIFFTADKQDSKESIDHSLVKAIKVCQRCPFRVQCLDYALKKDEKFGVWGGTSRRMRIQMKRCAVGGCSHPRHRRG